VNSKYLLFFFCAGKTFWLVFFFRTEGDGKGIVPINTQADTLLWKLSPAAQIYSFFFGGRRPGLFPHF
jgi:hypothetical protein